MSRESVPISRREAWLTAGSMVAALGVTLGALHSEPASAYPWMIHHGYTSCAQCHADPSGGGVLTEYGRAQGEILLRTHYEPLPENPGKVKDFLFGAVPLPETVGLQADVRGIVIPEPGNVQAILMQSDLRAAVMTKKVLASATLGGVSRGANAAQVTGGSTWNLVSREYWVGYVPNKSFVVRAGRMNLPFGLRTEDHILDVRSATHTNTNADQNTGLAVFYNSRKWRAEVMGIAGNYQVRPDVFRERGYSLYAAYAPSTTLEVGVSSLFTRAGADVLDLNASGPRTRLAEGVFARWAPIPKLAVLAEADLLVDKKDGATTTGFVSTAILDYEPKQGLHLQAITEQCDDKFGDRDTSMISGTGALQWFFLPHADVRLDGGYGAVFCTPAAAASPFASVQGHFYL